MPKQKKPPVSIYKIEGRLYRQKVMLELDEVRQRRKAIRGRREGANSIWPAIAALRREVAELRQERGRLGGAGPRRASRAAPFPNGAR